MQHFDWSHFLQEWNTALLANLDEDAYEPDLEDDSEGDLLGDSTPTTWLGYPGASEQQILELEQRLNVQLPPSYRSFLQTSNGFRQPGNTVPRLYSTSKVNWYRIQHQQTIDIWLNGLTEMQASHPDLPYLREDPFERYLPTTLQISAKEYAGSAVYLLNPQNVTSDGEWEAFYFANWIPGAQRYASFWDLMQAERDSFMYIAKRQRGEPTPRIEPSLGIAADDIDGLLAALANPDTQQQFHALQALGNLRDLRAFEPIAQILTDPNADLFVREQAARTIGMLRDPRSASLLLEAYRTPSGTGNITTAAFKSIFAQFPEHQDMPPTSLEALLAQINTMLGSSLSTGEIRAGFDDHLRHAIRQGLFELGASAVPTLRQALGDRDPAIRALAADVLAYVER